MNVRNLAGGPECCATNVASLMCSQCYRLRRFRLFQSHLRSVTTVAHHHVEFALVFASTLHEHSMNRLNDWLTDRGLPPLNPGKVWDSISDDL